MKSVHASVIVLFSLAIISCRKDDPSPDSGGMSPVFPQVHSAIAAVPLNGGNVTGRWTMTLEQDLYYLNDTLQSNDTTTYSPGDVIVNFNGGGTFVLTDTGDTLQGTYHVSGNQLTLTVSPDNYVFSFGIQSNNTMRWHYFETTQFGNDVEKAYTDYLFSRY